MRSLKVFSFREKDKLSDNNFCLVEFCPIIFIYNTGLEATFDIDEFSFDKKLLCPLCKGAPDNTVGVFCLRECLSSWTFVVSICCNRKCCNLFVSSRCFDEGIFGDISDKNNFVDSSHNESVILLVLQSNKHISPNICLNIEGT